MKIDLERLCKLAGVQDGSTAGSINETSNRSYHEDPSLDAERKIQYANQLNEEMHDEDEGPHSEEMQEYALEEDEEPMHGDLDDEAKDEMAGIGTGAMEVNLDEVIEIDEAMLVQELRRAKAMISEAARAKHEASGDLTESQLKKIIAAEVAHAMKDFNLTAGWVYGDNKPVNSKRGQIITSMPGIGFKK